MVGARDDAVDACCGINNYGENDFAFGGVDFVTWGKIVADSSTNQGVVQDDGFVDSNVGGVVSGNGGDVDVVAFDVVGNAAFVDNAGGVIAVVSLDGLDNCSSYRELARGDACKVDGGSCVDNSIVERLVTVEGKCEGDCAECTDMGVIVGSGNGVV